MTKQLIAFDLDDTLAVSKSTLSERMAGLLRKLLDEYQVLIISGGKFELFITQVVSQLEANETQLANLHLMPTCGTRYYRFNSETHDWALQYAEDLTTEEKIRISSAVEETTKKENMWPEHPYGEVIEDRISQISISLLGQQAPAEEKYAWAHTHDLERKKLRDAIAVQLPDYEVRIGGTTSIDITIRGIDKAYGMKKLLSLTNITKEQILFLGDKLEEGGNDFPVKAMGIDSIAVTKWEDTAYVIEGILAIGK